MLRWLTTVTLNLVLEILPQLPVLIVLQGGLLRRLELGSALRLGLVLSGAVARLCIRFIGFVLLRLFFF